MALENWTTAAFHRVTANTMEGVEDVQGGVVRGVRRACTGTLSKFRGNVRLSVQQKCHLGKPRWYQMMTFRKPRGIVALADPQRPCIS